MHEHLVRLIERIVRTISDNIAFYYARESDFNVQNDVPLPSIVLDIPTATGSFVDGSGSLLRTWNISMAFYQKDREDSVGDEYRLILDQTDEYVSKFIRGLNQYYLSVEETGYVTTGNIVIQGIGQTGFVKATSQILTGWILTMQIITPDTLEC